MSDSASLPPADSAGIHPSATAPVCFISYSWDSDRHKAWVSDLANALRDHGVEVLLDQWHCRPGDDFIDFMERSSERAKFVLIICTPALLQKDVRGPGGVFYEAKLIQGDIFTGSDKTFIPVLREGKKDEAVPRRYRTRVLVDFSDDRDYENALKQLADRLLDQRESPVRKAGSGDGATSGAERAQRTRTNPVRAFDSFLAEVDGVHHRMHPWKVRLYWSLSAMGAVLLLVSVWMLWEGFKPDTTGVNAGLPAVMLALFILLAAWLTFRSADRCEQSLAWCRHAAREHLESATRALRELTCYSWMKRRFQDELRELDQRKAKGA